MATEYKLIGEKGHRQVVKTIDVHEESFNAIKDMLESGVNHSNTECGMLIEDVFSIFGGNLFGEIVHLCLDSKLRDVVSAMAHCKILKDSVEPNDVYEDLSEALFPCMCYSGEMALYGFGTNQNEIIGLFEKYLNKEYLNKISEPLHFDDMDGNTAFGMLLFLSTFTEEDKN